MTKSEILFYYESRQNPNGDPDAENQPRLMHDDTIMVTDVRIKRTIRDYAKEKLGRSLFVDYGKNGTPVEADARAKEIKKDSKSNSNDYIEIMLENTFDVPLFGALVTIKGDDSGSQKLTGPVQFGTGRSVNKVRLIQPTITGRFVGRVKDAKTQHSTIGRYYSVEYALIKIPGAINPNNLGKYLEDKNIVKQFNEYVEELPTLLWDGTNELVTRSKYPQKSVMFIQVDYKDTIYNDLADLVQEDDSLKGMATELGKKPFNFDKLKTALKQRKNQIERIRVKCVDPDTLSDLTSKIDSGIKVETL